MILRTVRAKNLIRDVQTPVTVKILQSVKTAQTMHMHLISANSGICANNIILRVIMCFTVVNSIIRAISANHEFSAKRENHANRANTRSQRDFRKP
jgi:hypothetical protein